MVLLVFCLQVCACLLFFFPAKPLGDALPASLSTPLRPFFFEGKLDHSFPPFSSPVIMATYFFPKCW